MRVETIGDATLYLGDCLEILPTLEKVDAVITDPPYGVNLGKHSGSSERRSGFLVKGGYESYEDSWENFESQIAPRVSAAIQKADRSLVFMSDKGIWKLPPASAIGGVYLPAACGRNSWGFSSFSFCLMYGKAPDLHKGAKRIGIQSSESADKNEHPCPKPIGWMNWAVDLATRFNETVLDPFMGSGTTGVACANASRKFIGIEINEKYFDIACKRIEAAYAQGRLFA